MNVNNWMLGLLQIDIDVIFLKKIFICGILQLSLPNF